MFSLVERLYFIGATKTKRAIARGGALRKETLTQKPLTLASARTGIYLPCNVAESAVSLAE